MNKTTKNRARALIAVMVVFLVFGCREETRKATPVESPEVIEKESEAIEVTNESFDNFFERFSADSVFQLSRVNFPISYYMVDILDNQEEYVYTRDDFGYIDFTKDEEAHKSETDKYKPVTEKTSDTEAVYIRRGIDNGIRVEYYFEMDDEGKWYMVKVIDNST